MKSLIIVFILLVSSIANAAQWEYKAFNLFGNKGIPSHEKATKYIEDKLNEYGEDGWELVGFQTTKLGTTYYYFKREIKHLTNE